MHRPYQNIYRRHEDQELLQGQYLNSTQFNEKHVSKETGEKKNPTAVVITEPQHMFY